MASIEAQLLRRCEKERDAAKADARRLREAIRAFLTAYHHDIGWKDELRALERVINLKGASLG